MAGLDDDLALAGRLADAAGEAIRPHFRRLDAVDIKADASPVTAADRAAEEAMREILARERPEDGILGEEFAPVAGTGRRVWLLDPIDGTKAFVAGKPIFATLVALVEDGLPRLGCIDQPVLGERWLGAGGAAWFGGEPLRRDRAPSLDGAVLCATAPEMFESEADRAAFDRLRARAAYVSWGGDAYAYGLLALGTIDLVVEAGLKPFDLAALVPVVEGAGGRISDWRGRPLTTRSDGRIVAAGSAALHEEALAVLDRV